MRNGLALDVARILADGRAVPVAEVVSPLVVGADLDRPVVDVSSGVGGGGGGGDVGMGRSEAILPRGEVVTDGADDDLSTERTTPRAPSTVCLTVFSTVDWKPRAPSCTVLKRSMP